MKKIKKFKDFDKHLQIFTMLVFLIFMIVGLIHLNIILYGFLITFAGITIPATVSYLGLFISFSMMVMSYYYHKALGIKAK